MAEELDCGRRIRLNDADKAATAHGHGVTRPAARTNAIAEAEERAIKEAYAEANEYVCPDECPVKYIDLNISRPSVNKAVPAPGGRFAVTAHCSWKGKLQCVEDTGRKPSVELERQDLLCSDAWTIIFEDYIKGGTIKGKPPVGPIEEAKLWVKLLKKLETEVDDQLGSAIAAFRCPPEKCPKRRIRISLWASEKIETGPDAAGDIESRAAQWCRIEVKCVEE